MSAVDLIAEIQKLPQTQRRKIYQFLNEEMRIEEERQDNQKADQALREPGENIPWDQARKRLGWE